MEKTDTSTITREKLAVKLPSLWKVVFHNDDFTPMDFVIDILVQLFSKPVAEAEMLTMQVHEKQRAVVAVYTKEVAATKSDMAMSIANKLGHPLKVTIESA